MILTFWIWLTCGLCSGLFLAHVAPKLPPQTLGFVWNEAKLAERCAVLMLAVALGPSILILEWRLLVALTKRTMTVWRLRIIGIIGNSFQAATGRELDQAARARFHARYWAHLRAKQNYDAMTWLERTHLEHAYLWMTGEHSIPTDDDVAQATMILARVDRRREYATIGLAAIVACYLYLGF
jgi:hypothetical protein